MSLLFEWDPAKANSNREKHGVGFEEAASIFYDDRSITRPDLQHSLSEARYVTIGISLDGKLVVVSHTDRDPFIRIISPRKATKSEREDYEEAN